VRTHVYTCVRFHFAYTSKDSPGARCSTFPPLEAALASSSFTCVWEGGRKDPMREGDLTGQCGKNLASKALTCTCQVAVGSRQHALVPKKARAVRTRDIKANGLGAHFKSCCATAKLSDRADLLGGGLLAHGVDYDPPVSRTASTCRGLTVSNGATLSSIQATSESGQYKNRPTLSVMYVPLEVNRFVTSILLIGQ